MKPKTTMLVLERDTQKTVSFVPAGDDKWEITFQSPEQKNRTTTGPERTMRHVRDLCLANGWRHVEDMIAK